MVINGQKSVLNNLRPAGIAISIISVAEVYDGAFASSNPAARLAVYRRLIQFYPVVDLDELTVERFGELRSYLRRRGQLIGDLDLLIAATALRHDLTLLTYNVRHFRRIPELRLFQPG